MKNRIDLELSTVDTQLVVRRGGDPTGTGRLETEGPSLGGSGRREAWRLWFTNRIVFIAGTIGQSHTGL